MLLIRSKEWLEIKFITADLAKKKGGKIIHFKRCRIARRELMDSSGATTSSLTGNVKPANHNHNFTVNLELQNGLIRKVHPALIFFIKKLAA